MASISTDKNGLRRIQFVDRDGNRKTIYLGKVPMKIANEIKIKVEALNAAKGSGTSFDNETAAWVARIGDELADKLAAVALIPKRVPPDAATLGKFTADYIDRRTDTKTSTRVSMGLARKRLIAYFDAGRDMRTVTPLDADLWAVWLKEKYADATVGRTIKRARQFFRAALRGDIITRNPFDEVKAPSMANPDRLFFVTREMAATVMAQCPTNEWRLIFALCRFAGLRCPSELLALTWGDVDWERGRFLIHSAKLERTATKGKRFVPLFPEVRPYLEQAFDDCPEGEVYVIRKTRDTNSNLRTRLMKYVERAGLTPWPRLFQNLRATCETELAGQFPLHVVTAWLGNSNLIAAKHYLSVTEADFDRAVNGSARSDARTTQNPTQSGTGTTRPEMSQFPELSTKQGLRHLQTHKGIHSPIQSMAAVGLEPTRPLPNGGF